jgi:hypothetical protein
MVKLKRVVFGTLTLIISLSIFFALKARQLRIVSVSSNLESFPNVVSSFTVKFNKELSEAVRMDPAKYISYDVTDGFKAIATRDSLLLSHYKTPISGRFKLQFTNLEASDGKKINTILNVNILSKAESNLNSKETEIFLSDTEEIEVDNHVVKSSYAKLILSLPYESGGFKIEYISYADVFESENPDIQLVIRMKSYPPGGFSLAATDEELAQYLADIRKYRTEALEWIKAQGFKLEDYYISYTEPDLQDEFTKGRGDIATGQGVE